MSIKLDSHSSFPAGGETSGTVALLTAFHDVNPDNEYVADLLRPRELFARAHAQHVAWSAQYILWRRSSAGLESDLNKALHHADSHVRAKLLAV